MLVIVTEAVPERLRGYLSRWLLEVRAGVYAGSYSVRVRERLWRVVCAECGQGNAVLIWKADHESGFAFVTVGKNARKPVDWDGIPLVAYDPAPEPGSCQDDGKNQE
ncbi:type I-E CRISPR-associated endoribonuclease Cas2e [Desulfovibrio sp. ZJ369]|uniref:type I-E CRISPR-associated endoribonuclease Cas2e n=1 Tax=Desulfovibrio sp. ZJ369 TaxID=2709793 RepID=UPI0013EDCDFE|nr:type I-E CRISPR-associated endoribonuclease Cas2e [Desulfovibrio sp. ZJ369]